MIFRVTKHLNFIFYRTFRDFPDVITKCLEVVHFNIFAYTKLLSFYTFNYCTNRIPTIVVIL